MKDMTKGSPIRLILGFAIPLFFGMLFQQFYNLVDMIIVGRFLGASALAAVGATGSINFMIIGFCMGVCNGFAIPVAQKFGAKDEKQLRYYVANSVWLSIIFAVVMTVTVSLLCRNILVWMDTPEDILDASYAYIIVIFIGIPVTYLYNLLSGIMRSLGDSKSPLIFLVISSVLNIAFDIIAIAGMHLGVAGAAGASLISRMTACFILMWRLRDPKLDIRIGTTKGVNMRMVKQILHIGIPNGIENSIFQLGRVLTVSIIAMFGTTQIAANAIANNLDSMGVLPGTAMSLAIITVIGRCVGAGDFEQAEYYAKKMMKLTYVINGICCLVVILTMPVTLRLYGVSGETRHLGAVLALIHNGCAIFLWPAGFCLPNVMRAANDVKFPMCVSIASMFIFRIGLSYVTGVAMGLGAIGVWIAMIIDWIVRISFFVTRFFSGKWKTFYHGE